MDTTDRVAVITGASRGLGAGMARFFLDRDMRVAVCARNLPPFEDSERCLSTIVDVADPQSVSAFCAKAVERFGDIDLWINNAGLLAPIGPMRDFDPSEFAQHIAVNVTGTFLGSQAFVRHLHHRERSGVLINISSGAAQNAYAGWSAYCAGKAAVDRMSESIALEEAAHGIRVHAVAPGIIDTDMQSMIRQCSSEQFPKVQKFRDLKATDTFNTPAFVAEAILKLAFDPSHTKNEVLISLPRPS
jgi:NAD(P)-dependent dehydrogenase (short-subunit alcohol dehydrogenase family)